jgi:hypothetical protein
VRDVRPASIRYVLPDQDRADLIIAKLLAGRPKDIDDARALWRLHARALDAARMPETLRHLEEALSQGDLVAAFETIAR